MKLISNTHSDCDNFEILLILVIITIGAVVSTHLLVVYVTTKYVSRPHEMYFSLKPYIEMITP